MVKRQSKGNNPYTINVIDKSLDLLEVLAKESLSLMELVEKLEQPKSSLFRMITTFEERGYITNEGSNGKYCLSLKTLELTKKLLENNTLNNVSKDEMQRLVNATGESVNLGVFSNNEIIYVAIIEGKHRLKFTEMIGTKAPFHASAIGKVISAHLDREELDELVEVIDFEKITPNTILNKKDYYKNIEEIIENGYALDDGEVSLGARCIAAPIFNAFGEIEAAISISGATHRLPDEKLNVLSSYVISSASSISQKLGFNK